MNEEKQCYLVIVVGAYGRGKTVAEAAEQCLKAGGRKSDECSLRHFVGDDKATFNGMYISYEPTAKSYPIATGFKLGQLLKVRAF